MVNIKLNGCNRRVEGKGVILSRSITQSATNVSMVKFLTYLGEFSPSPGPTSNHASVANDVQYYPDRQNRETNQKYSNNIFFSSTDT